jgi:DMSO/TMAO reductase YedYZ molybdopterin-dependent catalytic subunit
MNSRSRDFSTRRKWLATMVAGGTWVTSTRRLPFPAAFQQVAFQGDVRLIGELPFEEEGRSPVNTVVGDELDGRLFTDLSPIDTNNFHKPTSPFYVRTRVSHLLDQHRPWSLRLARHGKSIEIRIAELRTLSRPQGLHLLECAGNTRFEHFGMIGIADWDGVPVSLLLQRIHIGPEERILISGFDEYSEEPRTPSVPGASWIFSRQDLENTSTVQGHLASRRCLADC